MANGIGSRCESRFMYINSLSYGTLTDNSGNVAGFPASNVATQNRSNVWVCKGNFDITTDNNKLYIDSDTYTIQVGSYSGSELGVAINDQISPDGFYIYYGDGGKFYIRNIYNGFTLKLSNQTSAIWDTIGFVGSVDINVLISEFEISYTRIHTSEYLYYDLGSEMDVSFFALLPLRNYSIPLSTNAVVNVKASNVDDIDTAPLDVNIPINDDGCFYFLEDGTDLSYRYVWITITDRENPISGGLAFSQVFLGGFSYLENKTVDSNFNIQFVDRALRTESQAGGLYFERYGRHTRWSNLRYSNLTKTQLETIQQLFYDVGKSINFYMTIDSGNFNNDISQFIIYGVFDGDPSVNVGQSNYFDANFEMRSN